MSEELLRDFARAHREEYDARVRELDEAHAALDRVRELHRPLECSNARCKGGGLHCWTCDEGAAAEGEHVYWPCPTIQAANGYDPT